MITVNEFMTPKPYTLREIDTIGDARKIMTEKHIRHIPITDNENRVLGLVTQRDVLAATEPGLNQGDENASQVSGSDTRLSDIMIRDVRLVSEDDSLRQAAVYMQSHKYGCFPVVTDNQLVGIITDSDFVSIAINLLEQAELSEEEIVMDDAMSDVDMPVLDEDL